MSLMCGYDIWMIWFLVPGVARTMRLCLSDVLVGQIYIMGHNLVLNVGFTKSCPFLTPFTGMLRVFVHIPSKGSGLE